MEETPKNNKSLTIKKQKDEKIIFNPSRCSWNGINFDGISNC